MLIAEPTLLASLNGLCGFILVIEDGEVDAYTPSGRLLGHATTAFKSPRRF